MPTVRANGIELDYRIAGPEHGEPLVLIRGLGTQRILWPEALVDGLASRGFRVVMHDNRDVGHSTKLDHAGAPDIADLLRRLAGGEAPAVAYGLADMAADVVGLVDALDVESTHVMGISMGGMIVQHLAASHGERLRSAVSIMSSSGAPGLPPATPEAMAALTSQPDDPTSRKSVIENMVRSQKVFGSPAHPTPDDELFANAARAYDRCHHPDGVLRQMAAVMADVDRHRLLASIRVPTLVIHGDADPLVPIECGRDTAARIEGARFHPIAGMGHDLPRQIVPELVELIADHAKRSLR